MHISKCMPPYVDAYWLQDEHRIHEDKLKEMMQLNADQWFEHSVGVQVLKEGEPLKCFHDDKEWFVACIGFLNDGDNQYALLYRGDDNTHKGEWCFTKVSWPWEWDVT